MGVNPWKIELYDSEPQGGFNLKLYFTLNSH